MASFVDEYLVNANRFYSLAMNQYDFYLKIMGIDVTVIRIKDESIRKLVFGSTFTSDMIGDAETKRFKYRIVINLNDMRKLFQQLIDSFEVYDNQPILELGDLVTYVRGDKEYKFKIVDVQSFSEAAKVLYRYTFQGCQEISNATNL